MIRALFLMRCHLLRYQCTRMLIRNLHRGLRFAGTFRAHAFGTRPLTPFISIARYISNKPLDAKGLLVFGYRCVGKVRLKTSPG